MDATQDTFSLMREALKKGMIDPELQKAFTQSNSATTGLTYYDLQAPALTLVPQLTPLRNRIPRVTAGRGIQANWRAITAFNSANISAGVGEGNRGGNLTTVVQEYMAAFRTIGHDDSVTFEAELAAEGYDDLRARMGQSLLRSLMTSEERILLAGNGGGLALGTTPTPVLASTSTGGGLSNGAHFVACVALTHDGWRYASSNAGVIGLITRTNVDGSVDTYGSGCARASAIATLTLAGGTATQLLQATVAPVKGAVAYAWFVGTVNAYASLFFAKVTSTSATTFATLPGSGNAIPADLQSNDRSANNLIHDGFLTMAARQNSGAYWRSLTPSAGVAPSLTSDAAGGIVELDDMLLSMWDNYKLQPDEIWCSAKEMGTIRKLILTGSTNASQRFMFTANQNSIVGSGIPSGYLSPYNTDGGKAIPFNVHPDMPPGTMMALTHQLPYPANGVSQVNRILCRRDYYQIEWPLRSRKYESGVYSDQVLQCYFLPGIGVINNIG